MQVIKESWPRRLTEVASTLRIDRQIRALGSLLKGFRPTNITEGCQLIYLIMIVDFILVVVGLVLGQLQTVDNARLLPFVGM